MNEIVEKIKNQLLSHGFEFSDKESTRDLVKFKRDNYEICLNLYDVVYGDNKSSAVIPVRLNSYVDFEYQGKNYRKKLSTKCDMPFSNAGDWSDIIHLINHPVEIDEKNIWDEIQQYNFENVLGQNTKNIENSFEDKNFKFKYLLEHKEKIIFKKELSVFKMLDISLLNEKAKKLNNRFDVLDSFISYTHNEFDIIKCSYGFHEGNISEYYVLNPGDSEKISKERFDKNEQYRYFWDYFEKFDELELKPLNRKAWNGVENLSKQIKEYQQEHPENKLLDHYEFKIRYITQSGEYFVDSFSNEKRSVVNRFILPLENSFDIFKEKFDDFILKSPFSAKDFVDKIPSDEFELLNDKNYYVINNSKDGVLISDDNYCVSVIFKPKDYDNPDIEKMKEIIIAEFIKENGTEKIKYSPMFGREIDIKKYFAEKKDKQNSIQETLLKFG